MVKSGKRVCFLYRSYGFFSSKISLISFGKKYLFPRFLSLLGLRCHRRQHVPLCCQVPKMQTTGKERVLSLQLEEGWEKEKKERGKGRKEEEREEEREGRMEGGREGIAKERSGKL